MKVNSIQQAPYNYNPGVKKASGNIPSFGNAFAVNFWDAVARGGFASSFVLQDGLGCCVPRTLQDSHRNEEITGKRNWLAAGETAIREFVTGPSMVVIPMGVLAASKKLSGTANEVPMENIAPLSDVMKGVLEKMPVAAGGGANKPLEYAQSAKKAFYERAFAMSLGEGGAKGKVSKAAKDLADELVRYDEAPKRNIFQQLLNKDIIKGGKKIRSKDQILDGILTKFTDTKKGLTDVYDSLLTTNMDGALKKPNKISSLVKDFSNFGKDVQKSILRHSKDGVLPTGNIDFTSFMEEFKLRRIGSKYLTNVLMVLSTALFLTQIPKMYSLSKTNPGTDAFRKDGTEAANAGK